MPTPQIVIDTNVLVAAQRSKRGTSTKLMSLVGTDRFDIHVSVPLVLEYEEVLLRYRSELGLTQEDVTDLVDALCALAKHHKIYFLWRPYLRDRKDEMVLELVSQPLVTISLPITRETSAVPKSSAFEFLIRARF